MEPTDKMPPTDKTDALIPDASDNQAAREKFEQARLSRRAALRKIGLTSGMAFFGLFAVDDLARLAIKRMEQHKETRQIAETVATEFKNSGIAFADATGESYDPCKLEGCSSTCGSGGHSWLTCPSCLFGCFGAVKFNCRSGGDLNDCLTCCENANTSCQQAGGYNCGTLNTGCTNACGH